jgi:hypothetical protein
MCLVSYTIYSLNVIGGRGRSLDRLDGSVRCVYIASKPGPDICLSLKNYVRNLSSTGSVVTA